MNGLSFRSAQPGTLQRSLAWRLIPAALLGLLVVAALLLTPRFAYAECTITYSLGINPETIPGGKMGDAYSVQFTAYDHDGCGYNPPPGFRLDSGSFPPGLTLDAGILSGVLAAPGTFHFHLWVQDTAKFYWYNYGLQDYTVTVTGTNQQPTFTPGTDVTVGEDAPPYNAQWATNISAGPGDPPQTLTFFVSNNNTALFSKHPAISADGLLSFTLAADANGSAYVLVYLEDNGGTINGGINHSPTVGFYINVTPSINQSGPTYTVDTTDMTTDHACGEDGYNCTLREAIEAANNDGVDSIIELAPGATYTVNEVDNSDVNYGLNGLPLITSPITINAHGARITRDASVPSARFFQVTYDGSLTLNEIQLENGLQAATVANSQGGAIMNEGTLVVRNSYFGHNVARYGGAISNLYADASIYNSTFYANDGGAIRSQHSLNLYSNTFLDNTSTGKASAVYLAYDYPGTVYNFYNNLFLSPGNSAVLCGYSTVTGSLTSWGANLATDSSCVGTTAVSYASVKAVVPALNGGLTNNAAIQADSAAIDVGNKTACQNTSIANRDQRGKPRSVDGNADNAAQCDIGAYEYSALGSPPLPPPETDPPSTVIQLTPGAPTGSNGWYRGPVAFQPQVQDASPVVELRCALDPPSPPLTFDDLPAELCPFLAGGQFEDDSVHAFYAAALDIWGNKGAVELAEVKIDATPPVFTCPIVGPFLLGSGPHYVILNEGDAGVSGVDRAASTPFETVPTESLGPKTLTFVVVDLAGNSTEKQCTYNVIYDFAGFDPPAEPAPALNEAKAGQAVPLKFSLAGDQGLEIIAAGYPASRQVDCESKAPTGPLEVADQRGKSDLSYDPETGWYSYGWKTDKGWAGTCRSLALQLADGTEHAAYFRFK